MDVRWLIWAGSLVFLIHDLEELAAIEKWTRIHALRLPEVAQSLLPVGTLEFGVSLAVLLVIVIGIAWIAARRGSESKSFDLFLLFAAILGINGVGHILQGAAFGGYVPGLITAVTLSLPYSVWVLARTQRFHLRSSLWLGAVLGLAILVHTPLAVMALVIGKVLG